MGGGEVGDHMKVNLLSCLSNLVGKPNVLIFRRLELEMMESMQ